MRTCPLVALPVPVPVDGRDAALGSRAGRAGLGSTTVDGETGLIPGRGGRAATVAVGVSAARALPPPWLSPAAATSDVAVMVRIRASAAATGATTLR